jgi:hypothetical protein
MVENHIRLTNRLTDSKKTASKQHLPRQERRQKEMATIQEKMKGGKLVSCMFRACVGRDENKKQVIRFTTWFPPDDLTLAKSRKAAKTAAAAWEEEANTFAETW